MDTASLYYRPSGKLQPSAPVAILVGVGLVAAVLGFAYGLADFFVPFIYANILLCVGLGALTGVTIERLAIQTHVRNPGVAALFGVACGAAAIYAAWVGWLFALTDYHLIWSPLDIAQLIPEIAEVGVWGLSSGSPVNGLPLYGIWLAEAGLILGFATVLPYTNLRKKAYCESCGEWLTDMTAVGPFEAVPDAKAFRTRLEQGEFAALGELKPIDDAAPNYSMLDLWRCPRCDQLHLLTIRCATVTTDKQGKQQRQEQVVVRHMLIDRESRDLILELKPQTPADETPMTPEA